MAYMEIIQRGVWQYFSEDAISYVQPICLFLVAAFAYLIGSINFGIVWSNLLYKQDVRNLGSNNAGATNMLRNFGKKAGLLTFLCDFFKGALSAAIGVFLFGYIGGYVGCLFAVFGHAFPLYYHFKGGKGVAAFYGAIALMNIKLFLVMLVIYMILFVSSKYSSLGSIISIAVCPLIVHKGWAVGPFLIGFGNPGLVSPICTLLCLVSAFLVIFLHRKNLVRLWNHTENKVDLFAKKDK